MSDLGFYQVKVFEKDQREQWKIIQSLWNKILKNDIFPHFFFEYGYLLVRYGSEFDDSIKRHLKKYETEYKNAWMESSETVSKNYKDFALLFHVLSKMAIENSKDETFEVMKVYERITHSAFNMLSMLFENNRFNYETTVLLSLANARAFTNGIFAKENGLLDD